MGTGPTRSYEPVVRDAEVGDRDELVRLSTRALGHLDDQRGGTLFRDVEARPHPVHPTIDADLLAAEAGTAHVLLGCLGPAPVGYAVSRVRSARGVSIAVVEDLYVEPEARGVGVGNALMVALVERARSDGCDGIEAEALPGDRATKNFFEGFGLVTRKLTVHRVLDDGGD